MAGAPTAALLGVALLLAGAGFDSPSLLVPGVGLLGLAVAAFAWVELARPRRLVRGDAPARVVEDEPYPVRIKAFGGRLPPPGGELTDAVLPAAVAIGPRWNATHAADVALRGRGRRRLGPARLEVRDPLGLWVRALASEDPGELLVLPRVEPVLTAGRGAGGARPSTLAGLEDGAAASKLDARAIELEVDGLRAYREGSPASRIHWPAVARTGELIERRLVAGADAAPLVVLDASRPRDSDSLDAAVRAAASLCVHLATSGGSAALLPGDRRPAEIEPDLLSWPQVHAKLALVEAGAPAPAVSRTIRSGAVFWVTASPRPALPQALRSGGAPRYLVAPPSASVSAPAFTVAGCEGRLVGARSRRTAGRVR
jgi:uncharacterized protein (DUF58 family)